MFKNIKSLLLSIKMYPLFVSVIPVFVCFLVAKNNNVLIGLLPFVLMILTVAVAVLAINLVSEYFVFKKGKSSRSIFEPIIMLSEKFFKSKKMILWVVLLWIVFFVLLLFFVLYSSVNLMWFVLLGWLGWQIYIPQNNLIKKSKYSEIIVFLLLGPLLFSTIYYAFTADFSFRLLLFSIPFGLYVSSIVTANYLQETSDNSLMTRVRGKRRYYVEIILPYVMLFLLVIFSNKYFPLLIVFLSVFRAYKLVVKLVRDDVDELVLETVQLQKMFSLLLFLGVFIEYLIK